jgi:transglutaminase-like putative cysteine protease
MFYTIRHLTKFRYTRNISESIMETRMHPRSDGNQRCLTYHLSVSPRCRVFSYRDYLGNNVHHFDIPGVHAQLVIVAESLCDVQPTAPLPSSLDPASWQELDRIVANGDYWEMLLPSEYAKPTPLLIELAQSLDVRRRGDPLTLVTEINSSLYRTFDYVPRSTRVDSPIDDALRDRRGVCQDFAHVMIALLRSVRIPARYVSGYLYHRVQDRDRSAEGATHAWVEVFLPQLGWAGFDPTNCLMAGERHIRTAIGRDYADVPPTKGIFRGRSTSELSVAVRVTPSEAPPPLDQDLPIPQDWSILVEKAQEPPPQPGFQLGQLLQQQQQQQQ